MAQIGIQSSHEEILLWIGDIISATEDIYLRKSLPACTLQEKLGDDLGIDSLGRVNLFYGIIDGLDIDRSETIVESWRTLEDVVNFVREVLAERMA